MQGDEELRKDIDAVMAIRYPGQFAAAWDDLMKMGGHRLRIVDKDPSFNCHAYATGISPMPAFRDLVRDRANTALANGDFVSYLIKRGGIRIVAGQSYNPENIVIYFKGGRPTHSARVLEKDGLLISKWGGDEIIEHGVWEVPTIYGDEYKVAIAPDPAHTLELLEGWLPRIA
jgi:hypothetical protein